MAGTNVVKAVKVTLKSNVFHGFWTYSNGLSVFVHLELHLEKILKYRHGCKCFFGCLGALGTSDWCPWHQLGNDFSGEVFFIGNPSQTIKDSPSESLKVFEL